MVSFGWNFRFAPDSAYKSRQMAKQFDRMQPSNTHNECQRILGQRTEKEKKGAEHRRYNIRMLMLPNGTVYMHSSTA